MKILSAQKVLIALCGILSIMCCQQISGSPLTVKIEPVEIINNAYGPSLKNGPSAVWINNLAELRAAWPDLDLKAPLSKSGRAMADFDFSTYGLLLISMGEMRTGGHNVVLKPEKAELVDGIAKVVVDWIKPEKGVMTTQAITHPCMLVQLRKNLFKHIEVLDNGGGLRTRISL